MGTDAYQTEPKYETASERCNLRLSPLERRFLQMVADEINKENPAARANVSSVARGLIRERMQKRGAR